ncbi:MAG: hypothetical protein HY738_14820 [Bacteroidia bacterium]|nr:hypothetical protein [Bacteroidia bacterium]
MNKKYIIISFLFIIGFQALSQKTLLEKYVSLDSVKTNWGPNRSHFLDFNVGVNFFVSKPESDSVKIDYSNSRCFDMALYYKKKISDYYSIGMRLHYGFINYYFKQNDGKQFPDTIIHKKEWLGSSPISISFYNRINFNRRGDMLGTYLDLGIYGGSIISSYHITKDKPTAETNNKARKIIVENRGLRYIEDYIYGINLKLGFNKYAFTCTYRLSNMFKNSYNYPELPRISVGIEMSLIGNNPINLNNSD